ncbi:Conserved_hypothetical protein [Hexamita inflata]|uniref:Uncharacterized protein n=1 Tax=Hexamita inflata TaxID=28002 RepID=A0ABP1JVA7_9EUKA
MNMFIFTKQVQQTTIQYNIKNYNVNYFALFGINSNKQIIIDSRINVTLSFSVLSAALICTTCDVLVRGSTLIFIASGQQLSGAILTPVLSAQFEHSFIQFRLNSSNSSGLVNVVKNALHLFAISNCFVTGYNYVKSDYNGIASSLVAVEITLNVDQLTICANQQKLFGSESITMNQVGTETLSCDVCNTSVLVYGICSDGLQFGVEVEGMLQCVFPFEYIENQCTCARGYLLNITHCSNVVDNLTDISRLVGENYNELNGSVTDIYSTMHNIDSNIVKNYTTATASLLEISTKLEEYIISNFTLSDQNLLKNTSYIEQVIASNATQLQNTILATFNFTDFVATQNLTLNSSNIEQYILSNFTKMDANQFQNFSVLENRLQANFTSVSNSLVNNISALANQSISGLKANSSKLEQYIIGNFTVSDTNIKTNVSNLELKLSNSINQLNSSLAGNISQLNSTILANLKQNSSNIELFIQSNYSKVNGNLLANASLLDSRIQSNFTSFNSSLASNISTLGSQITANLVANSSKLEQYITGNYSQVNAYLALNTSTLDLKINSSFNSLNGALANNISSLNSSSIASLVANSSQLEQYIASNYSSANGLLLANTNTLDSRIQSNFTSLNNSLVNNISALANQSISGLKANSSKLEQYIIGNFTVSDTNIKTNVSNLELKLSNSINQLNSSLAGNISQLNSTILANLKQNSSNIELFIQSNYSKVNGNLLANASLLDSRIQSNFTSFNSSLASNISTLGSQITANLVANSSKLEQYITGNYSQVNAYLALNTSTLDLKINSSFNSLNGALANNISSLNSSSIASLVANSSKLEQYIASNYSSANGLLLANTNTLDSRIQSNFTSLNNSLVNNISALANQSISGLKANSSKLEQYIIGNFTVSDTNIKTNVSNLELKLSNSINQLNSSLAGNISQLNSTILANLKQNSSNIELFIQSNYSKVNGNLLANASLLDSRIQSNFTSFNSSLASNISTLGSQITANLVANSSKLEQYITGNYSYADSNVQLKTSEIDSNMFGNYTQINITTQNLMIQLQKELSCSTVYGFYLNSNGDCVQAPTSCVISGQIVMETVCVCPAGYSVIQNECKQQSYKIQLDQMLMCDVPLFTAPFDLFAITRTISSQAEFGSGSVFSISEYVQNSFIDIAENVYNQGGPTLFLQNTFINIKIQVGAVDIYKTGAFLTNAQEFNITQLQILSRPGTSITAPVNTDITIFTNLIKSISNNAVDFNDIQISLNIVHSQCGIKLVGWLINTQLLVTNYKISGLYYTDGKVSLLLNLAQGTNVQLKNLNFKPEYFHCGNESSYIITQIYSSVFQFTNIVFIIGDDYKQTLNSIATNDKPYVFGGLITWLQTSSVNVYNVILDCNQIFNTSTIKQSGILIGSAQYNGMIHIQQMCLNYNLVSLGTYIFQFGVFGLIEIFLSVKDSSINIYLECNQAEVLGFIGDTMYTYEISKLTVKSIYKMYIQAYSVGIFSGRIMEITTNSKISQVKIFNSQLNSPKLSFAGLFAGYTKQSNLILDNIHFNNCSIKQGIYNVGTITGIVYESNIEILNIIISNVNIYGQYFAGVLIGSSQNTIYNVQNSYMTGDNYFNGEYIDNCNIITKTNTILCE